MIIENADISYTIESANAVKLKSSLISNGLIEESSFDPNTDLSAESNKINVGNFNKDKHY